MGLKSTPFVERRKNELAAISLSSAARLSDNDIMLSTTTTKLVGASPECSGRQTFPKCSPKDCKKRVSFNLVRSDSFSNLGLLNDSLEHQHRQQKQYSPSTTNDDCSHSTNRPAQPAECRFQLEITAPDSNSINNDTNNNVNNQNNNYLTEDSAGHSKIQSKTSVINRSLLKFSLSNDPNYDSGIGSSDSSRTSSLEFGKTPDNQLLAVRPPIPRSSKSDSDIPAAISSSKCQNSVNHLVTSCRNDSYTSGYSPAKAHRRKASLGTKDFAVVFPNLVADNIELRCRVVT